MAQKNSLTIEQYISLCDFNGTEYESKKGKDYINALSNIFPINNINDKPFTVEDILQQPTLDSFCFSGKNDFKLICQLKATPMKITLDNVRINEKIIPFNFTSKENYEIFTRSLGVAYMLTCIINGKEHIIKFGQTRTPFVKRLGSYNCGVVNNWRTASTSNIKMLQSMVTTRLVFNLYLYDCDEPVYYVWHGVRSVDFASSKSLAVEDIMVKEFIKQFHCKPLVNVQADATSVKD